MGVPTNYDVQAAIDRQSLAYAKSTAISVLYGINIGKAVVKLKSERHDIVYQDPTYQETPYSPDAKPNATGGYDKTPTWSGYMSSSLVGMPVMCPLKFLGGDYLDLEGINQSIPDILFETVIMTLTQGKDIKKTKITGRRGGTVKEYIGDGDWTVDIRAIISADAPVNDTVVKKYKDGVYPRDNMKEINKLITAPIAIPIECWFLELFNIRYLVIDEGAQIEQIEGDYENQRLVLPCISDTPLVVKILQ